MMYFTFDHGNWANRIAAALSEKVSEGVDVRLMVDEFGLFLDEPKHALFNRQLLEELESVGVHVEIFRPQGHRLTKSNRLHLKVCAIDSSQAYIGGSNIADHYLEWSDHNLVMTGEIGEAFHQVYDFIEQFTPDVVSERPDFHLSRLYAGDAQVWLTVPKQRRDIRRALLGVILDADKEVYIRSWYFIPDREILNALRSQAASGVKVKVLLSDKTRMPLIDAANPIHADKLTASGGEVYRYKGRYMHAKAAWNNHGDVVFGSANMDWKALKGNFECSIAVNDPALSEHLTQAMESDFSLSRLHQPGEFQRKPLLAKAAAHLIKLTSPWL